VLWALHLTPPLPPSVPPPLFFFPSLFLLPASAEDHFTQRRGSYLRNDLFGWHKFNFFFAPSPVMTSVLSLIGSVPQQPHRTNPHSSSLTLLFPAQFPSRLSPFRSAANKAPPIGPFLRACFSFVGSHYASRPPKVFPDPLVLDPCSIFFFTCDCASFFIGLPHLQVTPHPVVSSLQSVSS